MSNLEKDRTYMKKRTETQAFKASEEIMDILHDEESNCYKPWQFADYKVYTDTLRTTYEEIAILGKEEAMIRPGWKVEKNHVVIPNIFSKVKGVHEDTKLYREEVRNLVEQENCLFFKKFPFYRKKLPKNINKTYYDFLNIKGEIDKKKLITSDYWKYEKLSSILQQEIADKIVEFCKVSDLWKYKTFKVKLRFSLINKLVGFILSVFNKRVTDEKLMKVSIFGVLTNLNEDLLNLLQGFDYPMKVPKIIIYNNNKGRNLTFQDAITLLFMNSMGVDIVIYNPAGMSDIENYVKEEYYDIHRLEDIIDNLPFRGRYFFK